MVSLYDDPIELVDSRYEDWCERYAAERDRLRDALAAASVDDRVRRIEHVGSTAVPDLPAKDVVDVDVVVADDAVPACTDAVADALGGTRYENASTWHVVARRHDGQRFNVHVFGVTDDGWRTSVATRDVLRERPAARDEYADLKRDLAADHDDLGAYSEGKSALVDRLLREARHADDLAFDFAVPTPD
ncbi:GrpB family protein [Halorubellus sp. PRR65]|uniref:GrpB family protein n=1 Tax=Halorubellus sp. PRR65 TaxID=3098148 RepID=UPI002B25AA20|nr:GrpB family protein [Halorubellus sp. PRR65]